MVIIYLFIFFKINLFRTLQERSVRIRGIFGQRKTQDLGFLSQKVKGGFEV